LTILSYFFLGPRLPTAKFDSPEDPKENSTAVIEQSVSKQKVKDAEPPLVTIDGPTDMDICDDSAVAEKESEDMDFVLPSPPLGGRVTRSRAARKNLKK
jgi:hypothetical protein